MRLSVKYLIVLGCGAVAIAAYYLYGNMSGEALRGIASVNQDQLRNDSQIVKRSTIQSITWGARGNKMFFDIKLPSGFSCGEFNQGKIYLRPEGLSEDGDVSSFAYEIKCENNQFALELKNSLKALLENSLSKPDFFEKPEELVVTKIVLEGASGTMSISSYELQNLLGNQLRLKITE